MLDKQHHIPVVALDTTVLVEIQRQLITKMVVSIFRYFINCAPKNLFIHLTLIVIGGGGCTSVYLSGVNGPLLVAGASGGGAGDCLYCGPGGNGGGFTGKILGTCK